MLATAGVNFTASREAYILTLEQRISIDPNVHSGQPCVTGTRVPVYAVLELIEAGLPFRGIIDEYYPQIAVDDIKACIRYAARLVQAEDVYLGERAG